eukprot:CAMPEP_0119354364 /NCGR_PEP_ID=MMETSP1334-20130426/3369_1 /TAXON_ID=127549 /ORGANISM="Calcidiscus leptoporus, Strain RCC1130" /LENGTH=89 /DNA_ID=CAMNT_0007367887 /DNA_START=39 /DNA_END=308 /DNA_ORIENTATION=+
MAISMRFFVFALTICAVAAYVPAFAASQLSSSRIAGAKPLAAVPMERGTAGAIMMSGKEGPPDMEMFDPIYLLVACVPFLALLVKMGIA